MPLNDNLQEWYNEHMKTLVDQASKEQPLPKGSNMLEMVNRLIARNKIHAKTLILKDLQVQFNLTPYPEEVKLVCPICDREISEEHPV